jgi:hypothetical protein
LARYASVLHRRHGLSGVLAYTGGHFFHSFEGLADDVEFVLSLVRGDERHADVRLLCDEEDSSRRYETRTTTFAGRSELRHVIEAAHTSEPSCKKALAIATRLLEHAAKLPSF